MQIWDILSGTEFARHLLSVAVNRPDDLPPAVGGAVAGALWCALSLSCGEWILDATDKMLDALIAPAVKRVRALHSAPSDLGPANGREPPGDVIKAAPSTKTVSTDR
jgi:hypothetical protein